MPKTRLPENATIRSVRDRLRAPEDYLCGVLRNMQVWRSTNKGRDPYVTIGIMGDGKWPNYRLSSPLNEEEYVYARGYNGRSHKELQGEVLDGNMETWSIDLMVRAEVEAVLGEVRSVKRKEIT